MFVLLNQPYKFLCDASICNYAEWRKSFPTDATIAIYRSQLCSVKDAFKEEFSCDENHLTLKQAKSTDQGKFEFICNRTTIPIRLDVLCKSPAPHSCADSQSFRILTLLYLFVEIIKMIRKFKRMAEFSFRFEY